MEGIHAAADAEEGVAAKKAEERARRFKVGSQYHCVAAFERDGFETEKSRPILNACSACDPRHRAPSRAERTVQSFSHVRNHLTTGGKYEEIWLAAIGAAAFATTGGPAAEANHGVNCDTAHADIVYLEHEKKSTVERVAKGVSSVMPIGLVMHSATGTEDDSVAIATGEYNNRIDMRIAEIKDACGID